jgi:hypothetical protein
MKSGFRSQAFRSQVDLSGCLVEKLVGAGGDIANVGYVDYIRLRLTSLAMTSDGWCRRQVSSRREKGQR